MLFSYEKGSAAVGSEPDAVAGRDQHRHLLRQHRLQSALHFAVRFQRRPSSHLDVASPATHPHRRCVIVREASADRR